MVLYTRCYVGLFNIGLSCVIAPTLLECDSRALVGPARTPFRAENKSINQLLSVSASVRSLLACLDFVIEQNVRPFCPD